LLETGLKKLFSVLYRNLKPFLSLIATSRIVLGVAIIVVQKKYNFLASVVYAFSTAIGFTLALLIFAGIREQLERTNIPAAMKGTPIALITAGLLAMAFMGFLGIV
jgi:electron transport complex protein RnfA